LRRSNGTLIATLLPPRGNRKTYVFFFFLNLGVYCVGVICTGWVLLENESRLKTVDGNHDCVGVALDLVILGVTFEDDVWTFVAWLQGGLYCVDSEENMSDVI